MDLQVILSHVSNIGTLGRFIESAGLASPGGVEGTKALLRKTVHDLGGACREAPIGVVSGDNFVAACTVAAELRRIAASCPYTSPDVLSDIRSFAERLAEAVDAVALQLVQPEDGVEAGDED